MTSEMRAQLLILCDKHQGAGKAQQSHEAIAALLGTMDSIGFVLSDPAPALLGARIYDSKGRMIVGEVVDRWEEMAPFPEEFFDVPEGYTIKTVKNLEEYRQTVVSMIKGI
jgi:hypothetical protein